MASGWPASNDAVHRIRDGLLEGEGVNRPGRQRQRGRRDRLAEPRKRQSAVRRPAAQRVRWFRTFAMNVSQIYDEDDKPVEMKIELEKEAAN